MVYRFDITDGPDTGDLIVALFFHSDDKPKPVTFTIIDPENKQSAQLIPPRSFIIHKIGREIPGGFSFNFEGYYPGGVTNKPAIGVYSTLSKTGWVEF